ncbi:MAG: hypothetical protein ABJE66_19565 [Deltaproteobacteria bacterium]
MSDAAVPKLRQRGQWLPMVAAVGAMVFTLSHVVANMLAPRPPTTVERQREDQNTIVEQRKARLAELLAEGDHCRPVIAHELAKTLVFDGRSAREYASDYEQRCAPDPVVHAWGAAPVPHRH